MRTSLFSLATSGAFALLALSQVGATDCGEVIRDSGFDLWCDGHLCAWKVVRGDARRVGTWNEGDSGVELLGDDAAIEQTSPVTSGDGTCILFEMLANVDTRAQASLSIDVFADGVVERVELIPTSHWQPLSFLLSIKAPYTGVRFELGKTGSGVAQLARIHATISDQCDGLPVIDPGPVPNGAGCRTDAQCESGLCRLVPDATGFFGAIRVCTSCDPELAMACGGDDVCGIAEPLSPTLGPAVECVPPGDPLGAQCLSDAECAAGACVFGTCSTCRDAAACAGGGACGQAWPYGPSVCDPGAGHRTPGEPCATASDCASGTCQGTPRDACADGRPCHDDSDCPVDDGLSPGTCAAVGYEGGTCL